MKIGLYNLGLWRLEATETDNLYIDFLKISTKIGNFAFLATQCIPLNIPLNLITLI